ncbi:hypothetical protein IW146_003061 [Coemansia sp. RSA 922]|nr:hypothetical protein LPJ71_007644 [Coemansia sp. S17]KAJ2017232.1 hypothetical protein GGI14_003124 [Coemansia sp. S680]KAJ2098010.1 hypothetical protein IW146_010068 [Coemansia sp. RSA 922]KAJ2114468.1 hypothetical protein IW146_003061 [Coemansia sp. RSA 922]
MPLMTFKTPERVCWSDEKAGRTFFVVANTETTSKWRANPKTPLEDVVYSANVYSFKNGIDGFSRVASEEELQTTFKTTDPTAVIKSILSAGDIFMKEFELEVESQTTSAMNAASSAATAASSVATSALGNVKGYLSGFW